MEYPILLILLVLITVGVIRRRRSDAEAERLLEEPWRASLLEEEDEPLDEEAIRRAEDEFWEESWDLPDESDDQGIQP